MRLILIQGFKIKAILKHLLKLILIFFILRAIYITINPYQIKLLYQLLF